MFEAFLSKSLGILEDSDDILIQMITLGILDSVTKTKTVAWYEMQVCSHCDQ